MNNEESKITVNATDRCKLNKVIPFLAGGEFLAEVNHVGFVFFLMNGRKFVDVRLKRPALEFA